LIGNLFHVSGKSSLKILWEVYCKVYLLRNCLT